MINIVDFKGVKFSMDDEEHSLHCANNEMLFVVLLNQGLSNDPNGIAWALYNDECNSAFDEIFAAHRILGQEDIFKSRGGSITVSLNGHTFKSEGYDETSMVLDGGTIATIVSLSTTRGYTIDTLYEFHDIIKEFLIANIISI